jgi:hypothetical protein
MNKNGKLTRQTLVSGAILLILVVILFSVYATLVPEAQSAGDELGDASMCAGDGGYWNTTLDGCYTNASVSAIAYDFDGVPLSGLFSSSGLIFLVIMAGLIVLVVTSVMPKKK